MYKIQKGKNNVLYLSLIFNYNDDDHLQNVVIHFMSEL